MRGISHPQFTRHSNTEYFMNNPTYPHQKIIHVGQVAKFLAYDRSLRDGRNPNRMIGVPLGYDEFAEIFNGHKRLRDNRELSTVSAGGYVHRSQNPVTLRDFFITAEQCGIITSANREDEDSALVFERFAKERARAEKRRDEAIQKRKDKQKDNFEEPEKPNKRKRYYDGSVQGGNDLDDENSTSTILEFIEDLPHIPDDIIHPNDLLEHIPESSSSSSVLAPVADDQVSTIIDLRTIQQTDNVPDTTTTINTAVVTTDDSMPNEFDLGRDLDELMQPQAMQQ